MVMNSSEFSGMSTVARIVAESTAVLLAWWDTLRGRDDWPLYYEYKSRLVDYVSREDKAQ